MMEVRNTPVGKGLFATQEIKADTTILEITGEELSFLQTIKLGNKESYCLQIGSNRYLLPNYPFYLANHSCSPNCGVTNKLELVTIKDIHTGQELKWDYSTSMLERSWTLPCKCGSANCRGVIEDFDKLPRNQQQYYIDLKVVQDYILKKLGVHK